MLLALAAASNAGKNRLQNEHHEARNSTARVSLRCNVAPLKSEGVSSVDHSQGGGISTEVFNLSLNSLSLVGWRRLNSKVAERVALRYAILLCDFDAVFHEL